MRITKRKSNKIPRGYRLRPSTHKLISKLQLILKYDQDEVISRAVRLYFTEVNTEMKLKLNEGNIL